MQCDVVPTVPEHYQLRELLGEGGYGQVYQAWDSRLQRDVALKCLRDANALAQPDQLLAEARLAASLRHPAFVRIFGIEYSGAHQCIVMELVSGCTLRQYSPVQRLPEAAALDIVRQVAEAMSEAHRRGLVHGDLKPSNLMIEADGKVRILDFGLASRIDPLATASAPHADPQGTLAYLAPELLQGTRPHPQSDIYALGVVLYELATGARPFAHLNGLALAAAQMQTSSSQWPFPPQAGAALVSLVRAMTASAPRDRPDSMQTVAALARPPHYPQHELVLPERPPGIAVRRARRPRALLLAGLLAGLLILSCAAGLGVWLADGGQPPYVESRSMQAGLEALRRFDRDGSIDAAIVHFNAVLAHRPQHAAAAAGLSLAYSLRYAGGERDDGLLQRADASAQLALRQDNQLALGYAAQARVRELQDRIAEALALDQQALRLDPMNLQALNGQADILIRARRFDEAGRTIALALRHYPNERLFSDLLGILRFQQGDYAGAEQAFRRSIALEPDAVAAYANLNGALLHQDRVDEALRVLQQGLQIRPNGQLYSNLGTVLFSRGDYLGAAQAFERAIASTPGRKNNYLRWANLADTLRWIPGREDESRRAYREAYGQLRQARQREPGDSTLLSRGALYAAKLGEREPALQMTAQALAAAPASATVQFRAAVVYELLDQRAQALHHLQLAHQGGYPANLISSEPDLTALRRDPRYLSPPTESPP